MQKSDRNRLAVLAVLEKSPTPVTSPRLAQHLASAGVYLSQRTIRLYLNRLDEEGLTAAQGKRGRIITEKGLAELRAAQTLQRVGYLSARIDQLTYAMNFDLATRSGQVVVNTSLLPARMLAENVRQVCRVFGKGFAMGNRLAVIGPGEQVGGITVPKDKVAFCTVCSITINGVLLKHGVPTASRFGGLLEIRGGRATRFVEMIHYDGTTIDPLEVFIRGGMTNYAGAVESGDGLIGAGFREMPDDARDLVVEIGHRLAAVGLGGLLEVGLPGQSVLGMPVPPGRIGAVVVGGLNPIAVLEEMGYRVSSRALAGLLDYSRLISFTELPDALAVFL